MSWYKAYVLLFYFECDDFVKNARKQVVFCPKSLFFMETFISDNLQKGG